MADDTEIDRMLDEPMQVDDRSNKSQNGEKEKEKKHKKHKHHKHHKSHKSERKHDRKRSRSPIKQRSPSPSVLPSGKRRDVTSEMHQLAQTFSRNRHAAEQTSSKSSSRRDKSPELTPEERDLRTVFCKSRILD